MKAIRAAYRNAELKKPGKVYAVAGSGGGGGKKKAGRVKFVDRLMKKEKRGRKKKERANKKK